MFESHEMQIGALLVSASCDVLRVLSFVCLVRTTIISYHSKIRFINCNRSNYIADFCLAVPPYMQLTMRLSQPVFESISLVLTAMCVLFVQASRQVRDLFTDMRDGHSLVSLLEVLSGEHLPRDKGHMRFHMLYNVQVALDFLKFRQVSHCLSALGKCNILPQYSLHNICYIVIFCYMSIKSTCTFTLIC